jgi:hypothetical protein
LTLIRLSFRCSSICIHPKGAYDAGTKYAKCLTKDFCVHLNNFLKTCPRVETFVDAISSGRSNITDISVESKSVTDLTIGLPFLSHKRSQTLSKAFPNTFSLRIKERHVCLLNPRWEDTLNIFKAVIGNSFPSVGFLQLQAKSPLEKSRGGFEGAGRTIPLPHLVKLLPNLDQFTLIMVPVYTQTPEHACLIVCSA